MEQNIEDKCKIRQAGDGQSITIKSSSGRVNFSRVKKMEKLKFGTKKNVCSKFIFFTLLNVVCISL
jgi:hypothetical protein